MEAFENSLHCRTRAFCGLCRLQTPGGRAWRKMVAERYKIPGIRTESGTLAIDAADFCCVLEGKEKRPWRDPPRAFDTASKRAVRRACCGADTSDTD